MNQWTVPRQRRYDDFSGPGLDSESWQIVRMKDRDGTFCFYQDDNAEVQVGGGCLEITVNPFTRFHDTQPVQNNAKQMYLSTEKIKTPPGSDVTFSIDMAVETYRQIPFDLQDAYGTANLVDFDTGTVINVAATNDTVYAVLERLLISGVTSSDEHFVHRIVLDVHTHPGHEHHYVVRYRHDSATAIWYVDGRQVYQARTPGPVRGFHIGMGLFSSRDLTRFSRAEREHGQGATGRWGPWRIHTAQA